jgi:hypothetical protein
VAHQPALPLAESMALLDARQHEDEDTEKDREEVMTLNAA